MKTLKAIIFFGESWRIVSRKSKIDFFIEIFALRFWILKQACKKYKNKRVAFTLFSGIRATLQA